MFKKPYTLFMIGNVIHTVSGVGNLDTVRKRNKSPPYYRGRQGVMFYSRLSTLYVWSERFNYFMECKRK